ncbi:MAG TPA: vitamin K epoxide reductase family protein [Dehalococcoidia bacterium]|nr:vitamin K epoxide reductase family protein [Dehalococcoidia bacterium]
MSTEAAGKRGVRRTESAAYGTPSRRLHRLPAVGLALAGCGIATYLTLYQTGALHAVWEPLFGNGSRRILDSSLARSLPIPDAALGAAGYLCEAIIGGAGGDARWRRMPWLVVLYGAIVAAFFVGSIGLVCAQAFVFHAFCTLCLGSALISFVIAAIAGREPLATAHLLLRQWEDRRSWRLTLLHGEVAPPRLRRAHET